ncbi:Phospho-2-dehydro-3-deoxyheptonate aldolase [Mycena indigotica]|uniref:Phospho-2-dehydro-3-deoxyheptonate aldolase n=1 Tax=Mycena indigotica TaxID=2126181 RepID=A0A8H6SDR7_9AGAR|nr:Phospho-2-dehydro-3-deoxyheptonate aldolase [Mycena indigotica]KAF7297082.1 Phospho-2-dehydro-3-deoxyheptonate aldolase [Mycena indigotica]
MSIDPRKVFRFALPEDPMHDSELENAYNQQYIRDRRVIGYDPLVQPALLRHEIVSSLKAQKTIASARYSAARILAGHDDRVLVIVGPCSIHDPQQAMEYATLLKSKTFDWPNLLVIMRAYLCKPRTTVGWKGLINDPDINGSFQINKGLRIARQLLCDIADLGLPVGSELLDTISPQYLADLLSWGAIGARTTESQLHRELASGVSFPIGFKNGTDGSVSVAIDAMHSSGSPHAFMGVTEQGLAAIVKTRGNTDTHIILRGGTQGPNYSSQHVKQAIEAITDKKEWASIMIDCSHGNSRKNHHNQALVLTDVCDQLAAGSRNITGVMVESNINDGRQNVPIEGPEFLQHGVSITDACVNWTTTVGMMDALNKAVEQRRQTNTGVHV